MIRIEAIWLATEPLDMRAGTDTVLARVVKVFGAARPHHAYLFTNKRATRIKVLMYDGIGIWLAARRLNKGRFVWTDGMTAIATPLLCVSTRFDGCASTVIDGRLRHRPSPMLRAVGQR
ncbi:IS66 family insertion sequence element accessory protein TnpB [Cupriavidus sp. H18C2]|uniref:IS66 family insertion sequence element accessory protein TnpB n=1 Tax=Cupriavidus sp. H18C2 TaxID=3241602 RepID=UPI003BF82669